MLVSRGKLSNRQAIIEIGFQSFVPEIAGVSPEQMPVEIPIQSYRALIDTGAQRTCLARTVIARESLMRHAKRMVKNVHNEALHYLYWANLGIWANGTSDSLEEVKTYYALESPVEVIDIADNDAFDTILGMDVLQGFDFHFSRGGDFEVVLR